MNAVNPLVSSGNSDSRQNKTTYHERRGKKMFEDICNKNIRKEGGRKYSRYM